RNWLSTRRWPSSSGAILERTTRPVDDCADIKRSTGTRCNAQRCVLTAGWVSHRLCSPHAQSNPCSDGVLAIVSWVSSGAPSPGRGALLPRPRIDEPPLGGSTPGSPREREAARPASVGKAVAFEPAHRFLEPSLP